MLVLGPQLLFLALAIVDDHGVRGLQDGLGRAVVLLQLEDARGGKVALELQDVADVGPAPSVDRLILVADHADVVLAGGQRAQQQVLHPVGVLIFVHQQVVKPRAPSLQHVGMEMEELMHQQQQVAEIHRVKFAQALLVDAIDFRDHRRSGPASVTAASSCRREALVLGLIDPHPDRGQIGGARTDWRLRSRD